ncbi:MAG TPA: SDR family NAD(P)-dependent oxidoreductase [Polyangiaceae bacterium]|nr:SDR family NAD(P)-dependent oxidoreductase [Polyangiaceae bacterium]
MANGVRGLRILVTGATSGIGEALATKLAEREAEVLIHGRDAARVAAVAEQLRIGSERCFVADLSHLGQVSQLARTVATRGPLDVLVNDAGVGFGRERNKRELSAEGFELRFAVNFLAPFLLTEALLALGLPRRAVVNVASAGQAPLDRDDLQSERAYDGVLAYRRSKLALITDTFERAARDPTRSYLALHPGTFLATKMVREANIQPQGSAESGAHAVLAVIERALRGETGLYFDGDRPSEPDGSASSPEQQAWLRQRALELSAPYRTPL